MNKSKLKENIKTILYIFFITFIFIGFLGFVNFVFEEKIKRNEEIFLIKALLKSSGFEKNTNILNEIKKEYKLEIKNLNILFESRNENLLISIYKNLFYKINFKNHTFYLFFNSFNFKKEFENMIKNLNNNFNNNKTFINLIFEYIKDGKIYSIVFIVIGPGLWGEITATIGVKYNQEIIPSITIDDNFIKNLNCITGIEFLKQSETPGLGGRISEDWFKRSFEGKLLPLELKKEDSQINKNTIEAITGATITTNYILSIFNLELKKIIEEIFE
ncbi:MAG: FMN-binding protein [Spirochaetes bacterium]|nr:FMN-binding protein [Spirochaetota bacterium]